MASNSLRGGNKAGCLAYLASSINSNLIASAFIN